MAQTPAGTETETFQDRFHNAVRDFINTQTHRDGTPVDASAVISVEQETETSGYCETCWWEETVVEVGYTDAETGRSRIFTYRGGFAELMREL